MSILTLLVACVSEPKDPYSPRPSTADDSGTDPGGTDSGTDPPASDVDSDGWTAAEGDCDDLDAAAYPGAYDRPDDGIDGDCDGADRTCDCLVLDGGTTAWGYGTVDVQSSRSIDLAYLFDTGWGGTSMHHAVRDSFEDVVAWVDDHLASRTLGVATYDDYAYAGYGSADDGDKPFELRSQQTDDAAAVQNVLAGVPQHGGSDATQSGMEALYQALTGAGYDQDCSTSYDGPADVRPFAADLADPFGGTAGQAYDITDASTGAVGGMGFHTDAALRVIVYQSDSYIRDPENGYGSPGGCPGDAGFSDVVEAALDANAVLVAIATGPLALPQMEDLAFATDSVADLDRDGSIDELLVYEATPTADEVYDVIVGAVDALRLDAGLLDVYERVTLEVRDDPLGIVSSVGAAHTDVAWQDLDSLVFSVGYDTSAYGGKPIVGTVTFEVVGDGFDLATVVVDVEIAP